jgi:hypothetical protein
MSTPKRLTLVADTREQYPLRFPTTLRYWPDRTGAPALIQVRTVRKALRSGDYRLEEYPNVCIIERKASLSELHGNLFTADYKRFRAALERLRNACTHPVLLLDESLATLSRPATLPNGQPLNPDLILDQLLRELNSLSIPLLTLGAARATRSRVLAGGFLLRMMLAPALALREPPRRSIAVDTADVVDAVGEGGGEKSFPGP